MQYGLKRLGYSETQQPQPIRFVSCRFMKRGSPFAAWVTERLFYRRILCQRKKIQPIKVVKKTKRIKVNNEIVLVIILMAWLIYGRAFNLCLIIIFYYLMYDISHIKTVHNPQIYFTFQIFIDISVLLLCLLLAYNNINKRFILLLTVTYGFIVFSSLVCDGLRLVDEVSMSYAFIAFYDVRQSLSHPLDLLFAMLGSGRGELFNDIGLFIRSSRVYNRLINPNPTNKI